MKSIFIIFSLLFMISCNNKSGIVEPNNLIEKEVMTNILYDLSILEAVRTQISEGEQKFKGKPDEYIYKKYKIDSLQFAKSNQFYAADEEEYQEMFEKIKDRLKAEKEKIDPTKAIENEAVAE